MVIIVGKRVHCDNTLSSVGPNRRIEHNFLKPGVGLIPDRRANYDRVL